jgi:SAM-dependent methyltransferase
MMERMPEGGEQAALWNGPAGRAWVDEQAMLDRTFKPIEDLLVAAATASPRRGVLDVGCGTGATTLAVARAVGERGGAIGIDISAPMIALARSRAAREHAPVRFICASAEEYAFDPAGVDLIVSRFGVMFFADPVRAFANLRRAARAGAALRLVVWRGAADNPFMTTAERTAAPFLPNLPPRRAGAPGQFAFADRQHVAAVLSASGWSGVDIEPLDVACAFPARELVRYIARLGPVGMALQEVDETTRARVIDAVRPAFDPFVHGDDVRFTAACWLVAAGG